MPRQAKKVPRLCSRCKLHMVRRKYDKHCTWCKRDLKRMKREEKALVKALMASLSSG